MEMIDIYTTDGNTEKYPNLLMEDEICWECAETNADDRGTLEALTFIQYCH